MNAWKQTIVRSNQNTWSALLMLVAAFVVTAAILVLAMPALQQTFPRTYTVDFADGYDLMAANLAQGNGYRWAKNMGETMIREPGYPLFLAVVFKVAGYRIEAARWANWLLTIGIACMLMRLTRMVTDDRRTALIASLAFLFYPGTLIAEARGGVEILFIFAACVFMLAIHQAVEKGALWRYFVAGLAFGALLQVRSTPLVFPLLLSLYLVFTAHCARERRKVPLYGAILVLGMATVIAPWVLRNYMLVHEFVPTSTLGGVALQEGQYTCENLALGGDFYVVGRGAGHERGELASSLGLRFEGAQYFQVFYDANDEWAFNNALFQRAKEEYIKHPGLLATCMGKNLFNFWFLGKTWRTTERNMLVQIPLLVLALGGLYLLWERGLLRKMGIMLTFVCSILAVHLPTVGEARYSVPVFAFLMIPASVSITSIWHKYRTQPTRWAE